MGEYSIIKNVVSPSFKPVHLSEITGRMLLCESRKTKRGERQVAILFGKWRNAIQLLNCATFFKRIVSETFDFYSLIMSTKPVSNLLPISTSQVRNLDLSIFS